MGRGDYEQLTPEAIDQLWIRMRAGHAPKPTACELGLSTSTVRDCLHRCGGIRPLPRHRAVGRLSAAEREEILSSSGCWRVVAVERSWPGKGFVDGESRGRRERWPPQVSGGSCRAAGLDQSHSTQALHTPWTCLRGTLEYHLFPGHTAGEDRWNANRADHRIGDVIDLYCRGAEYEHVSAPSDPGDLGRAHPSA